MSKKSNKLGLSMVLCRLGMLLVWLIAAANITFYLQSTQEVIAESSDAAESAKSIEISDLLTLDHLMASDATIQIAGASINVVHINIALIILMAILATALLATAIAIIDLRNLQARRSRH
jgi:hypothetical protein